MTRAQVATRLREILTCAVIGAVWLAQAPEWSLLVVMGALAPVVLLTFEPLNTARIAPQGD